MKQKAAAEPREILRKKFMKPLKITGYRLAKETGIHETSVSAIVRGTRRITVNTALILGRYFGNTPDFWLGIQNAYDIEHRRERIKEKLKKIRPVKIVKK